MRLDIKSDLFYVFKEQGYNNVLLRVLLLFHRRLTVSVYLSPTHLNDVVIASWQTFYQINPHFSQTLTLKI
jgi:hypothetical protein